MAARDIDTIQPANDAADELGDQAEANGAQSDIEAIDEISYNIAAQQTYEFGMLNGMLNPSTSLIMQAENADERRMRQQHNRGHYQAVSAADETLTFSFGQYSRGEIEKALETLVQEQENKLDSLKEGGASNERLETARERLSNLKEAQEAAQNGASAEDIEDSLTGYGEMALKDTLDKQSAPAPERNADATIQPGGDSTQPTLNSSHIGETPFGNAPKLNSEFTAAAHDSTENHDVSHNAQKTQADVQPNIPASEFSISGLG